MEPRDDADCLPPDDFPEAYYDQVDGRDVPPLIELPDDFRHAVQGHLRQALAWLEDREASDQLRSFARAIVRTAILWVYDERAVTDVLAVLHRAVDRGDLATLTLVDDLPHNLLDGRDTAASAFIPLGDHALRSGAVEPLIQVAAVASRVRTLTLPAAWIRFILEAESAPNPRDTVVWTIDSWLRSDDCDPCDVADLLRARPSIHAALSYPPDLGVLDALRRSRAKEPQPLGADSSGEDA